MNRSRAITALPLPPTAASLVAPYMDVRQATVQLCAGLSPEDCALQSMPDASPVKWHLAHTTWFFETFVLEPYIPGYRHFHPQFRVLFNSYYFSVGDRHPRPERGLLSRPGVEEVFDYRNHVDRHMADLLADAKRGPEIPQDIVELGLNHEQQHQELIVTDLKHLLSKNPLLPAFVKPRVQRDSLPADASWHSHPGGLCMLGHAGRGFAFDNESPRHRVFVNPFEIASRPVTNREYLAFIDDGGYRRPELWLSDGWDTVQAQRWAAPLYWEERDGGWRLFTLAGPRDIDPDEPICHVSYYEASAYARWAGARLPTEAEWEIVAEGLAISGNFAELGAFHPAPPSKHAKPASPAQMFGDVWEWTQSSYSPYPGFKPAPGAVGEYNGKFMCNQLVLRGGSCATPQSHIRPTYRNFFVPSARWQFSGIRLARDA